MKSEVIGARKNLFSRKMSAGQETRLAVAPLGLIRSGGGRICGIAFPPVANGVEDEQGAVPKRDDSDDVERSESVPRKVGSLQIGQGRGRGRGQGQGRGRGRRKGQQHRRAIFARLHTRTNVSVRQAYGSVHSPRPRRSRTSRRQESKRTMTPGT